MSGINSVLVRLGCRFWTRRGAFAELRCWGVLVLLIARPALSAPPTVWTPTGLGGGGALYGPFFNPHDPSELYVNCDMSQLFHSLDFGAS